MMGGTNPFSDGMVIGNKATNCYYISEDTATKYISWDYIGPDEINEYEILTLEEFLEKYPFKVGDKVVYTKFGDNCDDYPVTIESMKWTGTTIEYMFNDCVTCLAKDLRMWNGEPEEPDKAKAPKLKGEDYSGKRFGYKIPDGYEFDVVVDGKIFLKPIKPKYPDNYEECVRIAKNIHGYDIHIDAPAYRELMESFIKLLICREAYWKIAGEELGLGKPWEPDWNSLDKKHNIYNYRGVITVNFTVVDRCILIFPTKEIRDTFYRNFIDLIEKCKELL
jgi:hypothetical protein